LRVLIILVFQRDPVLDLGPAVRAVAKVDEALAFVAALVEHEVGVPDHGSGAAVETFVHSQFTPHNINKEELGAGSAQAEPSGWAAAAGGGLDPVICPPYIYRNISGKNLNGRRRKFLARVACLVVGGGFSDMLAKTPAAGSLAGAKPVQTSPWPEMDIWLRGGIRWKCLAFAQYCLDLNRNDDDLHRSLEITGSGFVGLWSALET